MRFPWYALALNDMAVHRRCQRWRMPTNVAYTFARRNSWKLKLREPPNGNIDVYFKLSYQSWLHNTGHFPARTCSQIGLALMDAAVVAVAVVEQDCFLYMELDRLVSKPEHARADAGTH